jgi:C4-dicarboxylate-specific signal transduction histidine kinase
MAAQFQANDARALAVGAGLEVEEVARYVDGLSHTSIVHKFPILDSRGQVIALGGIATDITERKRAAEALRAAQAELTRASRVMTMGELTASIAHEVNQPLTAVITGSHACLRWLAGTTPNLDEARQALDRIIRDGNRASDVIARIRALVGKTGTEKGSLDVNEVIQEVVAVTQGEVMRNGIALGTELADRLPPVVGDRVQLQQVMLNLIMNGIEAMNACSDRPKELLITTQQRQGHVRVAVRDSGVGLDQQSIERLFEAFYTTKLQGLGIGLSISRSIIEEHSGRLWAVRNDGPGATFQFTLPVYDSAAPLQS